MPAAASPLSIEELATENSALKAAVVDVIHRLDLPAADDAPDDRPARRSEVLQLLLRILHREVAAAPPVPSRIDPTAGSGAVSDPPEVVEAALRGFLAAEMPDASDHRVIDVRRMAGGASREAWTFDVTWTADGEPHTERCVMLRHPVSSVLESDESVEKITGSRRLTGTEFKVIRLMEAQGIPVPHMLWADPDGTWLERPFSIGRWLPGTADVAPLVGTERAAPSSSSTSSARPAAHPRSRGGRHRLPRRADGADRGARADRAVRARLSQAAPRALPGDRVHDPLAQEAPAGRAAG